MSERKEPAEPNWVPAGDEVRPFPLDWASNPSRYNLPYGDAERMRLKFIEDGRKLKNYDVEFAYRYWLDYPMYMDAIREVQPPDPPEKRKQKMTMVEIEAYCERHDPRDKLAKHLGNNYDIARNVFICEAEKRGLDSGVLHKAACLTKRICGQDPRTWESKSDTTLVWPGCLFTDALRDKILDSERKLLQSGAKMLTRLAYAHNPLGELIATEESQTHERKSSVFYDYKTKDCNNNLKDAIVETVAGFMNKDGGTLLIGMDDNGRVLGLENDYACLKGEKKNNDGYLLRITHLLLHEFGNSFNAYFTVKIERYNTKDICIVVTKPAKDPIWISINKERVLPVRIGNMTKLLMGNEADEYLRHRQHNH